MAYFVKGAFSQDAWATRELLAGADFKSLHSTGAAFPAPLGLKLDPGFAVETLAGKLDAVALIAIAFPRFTDGRGYSMGWLLRTRLDYKGEMRAIGDVLFDEMQLMVRCGFDSFDIVDHSTLRLLESGRRASFDRFYQPGLEPELPAGTRPWARRPA